MRARRVTAPTSRSRRSERVPHAPDGLVEAISVGDAPGFALAVQWHPEWHPTEHPLYDALFRGFAEACHSRRAARIPQPGVVDHADL